MPWSCTACTFENSDGDRCELCETPKPGKKRKKSGVQATLFGSVAAVAEPSSRKSPPPPPKASKALPVKPETSKKPAWASREFRTDPYPVLEQRCRSIMKSVFGINKLRYLQPAAVECALRRQSQMIIMATGGGKSLCYQLPAVVLGGTTVVISPLLALLQDQVESLKRKGVAAAVVSSAQGDRENRMVLERLLGRSLLAKPPKEAPHLREPVTLLYVTPEQIQTTRMRNILHEMHKLRRFTGFAVDEAHCVSSWGHDFRPAYRNLDWLRVTFPDVPCLACTATATPRVLKDVEETLHLMDCPRHMGSFDRPNLFYKVRYKDSLEVSRPDGAIGDLVEFVKRQHQRQKPCSGIIYVHKRDDTVELASMLRKATGLSVAGYHGGMKDAERSAVQQNWTVGKVDVAIATIAFGMGIDLAHVRYVVHWSMPKTIEGFYQESGRAGRDGLPSYSILYYSREDASKFEFLISQQKAKNDRGHGIARKLEALEKVVAYCTNPGCRRKYLLRFFGDRNVESETVCSKACDFCSNPAKVKRAIEAAKHAHRDTSLSTSWPSSARDEWDGQWEHAHGDDIEETEDAFDSSGLGINSCGVQRFASAPNKNVGSMLAKYEAIECQHGVSNGFVTFKTKEAARMEKQDSGVRMPEHLIAAFRSKDAVTRATKPPATVAMAKDVPSSAVDLKALLEQARNEKEARLRELSMLTAKRTTTGKDKRG